MDNTTITTAIGLGGICAILYRLGGIGKPFKTWMRDWVIPPIIYGYLVYHNHNNWWLLFPAIILTGGALTTYLDKLSSDGEGNFYLHGFMVGLGAFPFIWAGVAWWLVVARAVLLGLLIGKLNWLVNKFTIPFSDWIEELGRGFLIGVSILLLLIFL